MRGSNNWYFRMQLLLEVTKMLLPAKYTEIQSYTTGSRKPDFDNLLRVLAGKTPSRPTLFEFFLHDRLYQALADEAALGKHDEYSAARIAMSAYQNAGYDYVTMQGSDFCFKKGERHAGRTISLNEGALITDRPSYERYIWHEPENFDYARLDVMGRQLPDGMKIIVWSPGGVLENVIDIVGYENLCFMLADDPDLVQRIFDDVGSRLVGYYKICGQFPSVGAMISNDDWGFKTQTMLSASAMRCYVVPWHKRIVEAIHASGRPAILHSCGNLRELWDDIIDVIGYEAKHSYEDNIEPVEAAYDRLQGKIAVLGGLDLDFLCRGNPEDIYHRSLSMLERAAVKGGYALGSGNSIPDYVPTESFLAMIAAARWA